MVLFSYKLALLKDSIKIRKMALNSSAMNVKYNDYKQTIPGGSYFNQLDFSSSFPCSSTLTEEDCAMETDCATGDKMSQDLTHTEPVESEAMWTAFAEYADALDTRLAARFGLNVADVADEDEDEDENVADENEDNDDINNDMSQMSVDEITAIFLSTEHSDGPYSFESDED